MKRLAATLGLAAGTALAQAPQDFGWRAEISAVPGLNVVTLTEPVYRAARTPDLHDLRFYNARGESLPFAPAAALPPAPGRAHALTMVPLPAQPQARDQWLSDFALRIEKDGARSVIELKPAPSAPPAEAVETVGGYLLDLRAVRGQSGAITLRFANDAPDFAGRVELAGSDDLHAWRPLATAPLVRNRQFGDTIERTTIEVAAVTAFVRLSWSGTVAPRLDGAQLVEGPASEPLPRARLAVAQGDDARTWFVDVPPALPVVRIWLRTPGDNVSVRVRVFRYDERDPPPRARLALHARRAPERWIAEGGPRDVFRLNRGGEWIENGAFTPSARTTQLRIDVLDEKTFGDAGPIVEAEWQPQRIVFAASGPAPYLVAAGNDAKDLKRGPSLALRGVLPDDDPAATRLPAARIAAHAATVAPVSRAERMAREAAWSRYVLWAALGAAVLALAFMAWRLALQLKASGDPARPGEAAGKTSGL